MAVCTSIVGAGFLQAAMLQTRSDASVNLCGQIQAGSTLGLKAWVTGSVSSWGPLHICWTHAVLPARPPCTNNRWISQIRTLTAGAFRGARHRSVDNEER